MTLLQPSEDAYTLLRRFEGLRLEAYKCSGGVWTNGYGHTRGVKPGDVIQFEQAEEWLEQDAEEAADAVRDLVKVSLTQGQFDALVSFVFNLGRGALKRSTLLKELNVEDYRVAALEFRRWIFAGGNKMRGLEKRRAAEQALFKGASIDTALRIADTL